MKRDNILIVAAAAFAAGYIAHKVMQPAAAPAAAPTSPMTQLPPVWANSVYTANAVRGIGVAQYGNCQCANGTMCVGRGNCACCDKAGGVPVRVIITGKPAMQALQSKVSGYGYGGGLA